MKRLFACVPVVLMVLFLLNSFVLTETDVKKKPVKEARSAPMVNIIYRSMDGGQTWQDISAGLPQNLQKEGVWNNGLLANERGLFLRTGNVLYHNNPNSTSFFWTKETFPGKQRNITAGKDGLIAYDFRGRFLHQKNGTNNWLPLYSNFQEQAVRLDKTDDWMYRNFKEREVRTVFETTKGTVLIGSNNSLFRSANNGKTWKQIKVGDGRMKFTEAEGVILTISKTGIWRSADDGENWEPVLSEGGLGVAVERINGGFAAIVYNITTQTNTVHISPDGGKTWKVIAEELQPSLSSLLLRQTSGPQSVSNILSIRQAGEYLICGRSDGLFRSADMGKTWKLLLPSAENRGFNLSVSGNVIYAIPNKGC